MGSTEVTGPLLTQLLDEQAEEIPEQLYCIHPISQDSDQGWHHITTKDMARAVDRLAWWIEKKLGAKGEKHVLAYIGTNDLRYATFILACMKTGHAALLLSTRNSQVANQQLLRTTKCSVLVDGSERANLRNRMNELHKYCPEIERWHMDPIWDIFSADSVQRYPQKEPFDEIEDRTAVIIHSSGTTGLPKPVRISHGYLATLFYMQELPVPEGRETTQLFIHEKGHLRFQSSPMFHFMGLVCISECIFFRTPFLLAPDRPLTTDLFSQIMSLENPPKWGLIAPFILEQLCASEKGRKALSKLSSVNFGSAPLSADAGKTLSSLVQLQQLFGSSETGYAANLRCEDPEDWNYLEWVPAFGTRMDDAGDGLFELVLTRTKSRRCHGIFHTDPDLTEYKTGDLFRAHDSKSGLWLYQGRGDDIIVLTNGEKFNPTEAEKVIESHSLVNHAAILGQDKFQPSLLVEPNWRDLPDDWTIEWLQQALQSKIDDANALLPGHGKIFHSHVAFASEDKPFALSPKGTLRRREITKTYESVIDQLYTHDNQSAKGLSEAQIPKLGGSSLNEIEQWIQDVISNIISLKTVNLDDEVVALGMDSLQVVRLIQVLQDTVDAMKAPTDQRWTNALIYDLETPRRIANSLHHQLNGATAGSDEAEPHQNAVSREDMLARYTWEQSQYLSCGGTKVILTGSTGELGSFLLDRLLRDPSITQITCLNRSADAAERQLQSFRQKQLSSFWLTDTTRVTFKQAKLHEPHLGLDPDTYKRLEKDTSVIIHNAWPVNFNQNLASFEPHLAGVRRLLNLAEHSALQPEFHFVSSISTVAAQSGDAGQRILERPQDPSSVLPQGYAESKFVAERLCEISSKRSGAKIAIHRVGQLGGPSSLSAGMWNMRDWFPSLVRSSLTMEKLPDSLGSMQVDWLPIDTAAQIISQIIDTRRANQASPFTVYHITNPNAVEWMSIAPLVAKACRAELVPLNEWLQSVKSRAFGSESDGTDLHDLPATQLLDFFTGLASANNRAPPPIDVSNSTRESETLAVLGSVGPELMKIWLKQWKDRMPGLALEELDGAM